MYDVVDSGKNVVDVEAEVFVIVCSSELRVVRLFLQTSCSCPAMSCLLVTMLLQQR